MSARAAPAVGGRAPSSAKDSAPAARTRCCCTEIRYVDNLQALSLQPVSETHRAVRSPTRPHATRYGCLLRPKMGTVSEMKPYKGFTTHGRPAMTFHVSACGSGNSAPKGCALRGAHKGKQKPHYTFAGLKRSRSFR